MTILASLNDTKIYLGLGTVVSGTASATADDAMLDRLITGSSAWFESEIGYTIGTASVTESFDGDDTQYYVLRQDQPGSVTSVTVDEVTIPTGTINSGSYTDGYFVDYNRVILVGAYTFTRGVQNCVVTYGTGLSSVPADVQQAVIELTAMAYRERTRLGVINSSIAGDSTSYSVLTIPWRVQRVMDNYRRIQF